MKITRSTDTMNETGSPVTWGEHVTDGEYPAASAAS